MGKLASIVLNWIGGGKTPIPIRFLKSIDVPGNAPAGQIQSDWNQDDNTKVDYIKNKPDLNSYNTKHLTILLEPGTFTLSENLNLIIINSINPTLNQLKQFLENIDITKTTITFDSFGYSCTISTFKKDTLNNEYIYKMQGGSYPADLGLAFGYCLKFDFDTNKIEFEFGEL